jgi:hypothetical protein
METPQYSDINDAELREIEAEFGRPLTRELAQWFIRNRTNREAVERMLRDTTELTQMLHNGRDCSLVQPYRI